MTPAKWAVDADRNVFLSHHVCDGSLGSSSRLPPGRRPHRLLRRPQNCRQHWPEWPPLCRQLVKTPKRTQHNCPETLHTFAPCLTQEANVWRKKRNKIPAVLCRWSGFLLCSIAMLLVIFPMFAFPKKLPPRHKKRKAKKMGSPGDASSDDDVMKEKSCSKSQNVSSSMGFGKDIKGEKVIRGVSPLCRAPPVKINQLWVYKWTIIQSVSWISRFISWWNLWRDSLLKDVIDCRWMRVSKHRTSEAGNAV